MGSGFQSSDSQAGVDGFLSFRVGMNIYDEGQLEGRQSGTGGPALIGNNP